MKVKHDEQLNNERKLHFFIISVFGYAKFHFPFPHFFISHFFINCEIMTTWKSEKSHKKKKRKENPRFFFTFSVFLCITQCANFSFSHFSFFFFCKIEKSEIANKWETWYKNKSGLFQFFSFSFHTNSPISHFSPKTKYRKREKSKNSDKWKKICVFLISHKKWKKWKVRRIIKTSFPFFHFLYHFFIFQFFLLLH